MLKRKILDSLISWKSSPNKVALLVKGARQVGKTTSIRDFGKNFTRVLLRLTLKEILNSLKPSMEISMLAP